MIAPDEEAATVSALSSLGVSVGTRIPQSKPESFIRVVGSGGVVRDLVTVSPTVTVDVFHESEVKAKRLASRAVALIEKCAVSRLLGDVVCYRVQLLGLPSNLPMPSVPSHYRYTFSFSADLRKVAE